MAASGPVTITRQVAPGAVAALAMAVLAAWFAVVSRPAAAAELVMVEEAGCVWCERWNAEIGPIYPRTAESRAAPLRRVDMHGPGMKAVDVARPVNFTPTFILVEDGRELARIEGYPGEDFFWGLLQVMLVRHIGFDAGS